MTSKLKQSQIIGAKAGHNFNGMMKEEGLHNNEEEEVDESNVESVIGP